MIEISDESIASINNHLYSDAKKELIFFLRKQFPYEFADEDDAKIFIEKSLLEMGKYPIANQEMPYWCLLTVLLNDFEFHQHSSIKPYFSQKNLNGKIKMLYQMVAQQISAI